MTPEEIIKDYEQRAGIPARMHHYHVMAYTDEFVEDLMNRLIAAEKAGGELLLILAEISEGKGRYNPDKLIHASNTIEDMKELAVNAINECKQQNPNQ